MAKVNVNKEEVFRAQKNSFAVAPTSAGYTLAYSADGISWNNDTDAVVPANETLMYIGAVPYAYYKLSGNVDDGTVIQV